MLHAAKVQHRLLSASLYRSCVCCSLYMFLVQRVTKKKGKETINGE
jgi:hypothetical protein